MEPAAFKSRWPIATLLSAALLVSPAFTQAAEKSSLRVGDRGRTLARHGTPLADKQGRVQMFVRFDEPAVAELNAESLKSTGNFASPQAQRAQAQRVTDQQTRFRSLLSGRGVDVLSAQRVGANGFRVLARPADVASLRSLAGVRSIAPVELHSLDNVDSVPWVGAPEVWSASGRGDGVKIGIIDTGIDYTHAAFGGSGNPSDYAANDPNVIEPGTFPTAKVKGGYDFAGPTYNANVAGSVPQPDTDPLDRGGHGSHVAGSAAGIGVPGIIGPGVAPNAELYALKVFGDAGGSTGLTSLAIEWAMDPNGDGDMSDHLDVINMSLGSPFGEPDDPSAISADNAAAVGIIVVASAGNEGSVPYITGSPAVAGDAISIAANTPGDRIYARLRATSPASVAGTYFSEEGTGPVTFGDVGSLSAPLVSGVPADGCTPLTNAADIDGKVALIIRGTCTFVEKYLSAQAAGAKAIVVYNDGAAADRMAPLVMSAADDRITIPGLMISFAGGSALAAAGNVQVTLDTGIDPLRDDLIAPFSSRGPGQGGSTFKPDLSAPGVSIVSVAAGSGTAPRNLQGTSMAAPHVAGAAALLRQQHPTLEPAAIKALLQNSTVPITNGDSNLTRHGVGALRVDRAAALSAYASPGGVTFGRLNPIRPIVRNQKVTLKNLSSSRRSFTVTHEPHQTYPGVTVDCPNSLRLSGKGTATFLINLHFDPRAAWRGGAYDSGIISQSEVDGWCVLSDGKDTLRVGYIAVVDAASTVMVLPAARLSGAKVINPGPALGWAEAFTLAKLGGEEQNRTYGSIAAVGFRRAPNPARYAPFDVLELGFVLERHFEHLSNITFELGIDTDADGSDDLFLIGTDLSNLISTEDPGQFVTAQIGAEDAFIDWEANDWDYNDRTLFLPFTLASNGGMVPDRFDYTLTVTTPDGEQDIQHGSVDLAQEIVPDVNSFAIEPGDSIDVGMQGPNGTLLWLLQNNAPIGQSTLSLHFSKKK